MAQGKLPDSLFMLSCNLTPVFWISWDREKIMIIERGHRGQGHGSLQNRIDEEHSKDKCP